VNGVKSKPKLVLGSSSPRRRDLLDAVGLSYTVLKPETPEVPLPGELPEAYARRNAIEKAAWVVDHVGVDDKREPGIIVISADTIVVLDNKILEKPVDSAHAKTMLHGLSGRWHTVISGVTLQSAYGAASRVDTFAVQTRVLIKALSKAEIESYVRTGEPLDKAGGYAAQGIGSYMVERIEGSYANVVGLPIAEVVKALEQSFGYTIWG
jgi:septum formation protein